uniref:MDM2 proto-oncogene n=1 Tax=Xiphophorus maculatus TaxID=8083 RepID=A0A3B5QEG5_XIPMA
MSADGEFANENKLVSAAAVLNRHFLVLQRDSLPVCVQVRPKVEFGSLLQHAGATKDVFTIKEVMFYLGQYIIQRQLYDQNQQHIVHCAQDALGRVLGVDSFSFCLNSSNQTCLMFCVQGAESSSSSTDQRRRRRRRSNSEERQSEDEESDDSRKRRRSDSFSLTFDGSLSWCVIGGLGSGRDNRGSQSSDSHSVRSGRSEVTIAASDSDSDNFSVEFEVESVDSDDYNEDDASLSVYEVTIFEADGDDDSFDDDTEITEADYWRCSTCDELNPPLPRNCFRCWTLRHDWLPEASADPKALPTKPTDQSAINNTIQKVLRGFFSAETNDDDGGVDVPDGKRAKTPLNSQSWSDCSAPNSQNALCSSQPSSASSSQEKLWTPESQPSSSGDSQDPVPDLERSVSAESRLPDSCLDPCLICQSRPKNGCIVHGRTGHLMSCYVCARKLKRRNKLCPVCRMPIQSVVLTYLS